MPLGMSGAPRTLGPMDLVLIPGFWLDGDSWAEVAEPLRAAGHTVHAVTLPGKESVSADRARITLQHHVDAVVALVDTLAPGVVLVGHSGGGAIAHAVVDARPDRVARVIYVDSGPLADGGVINDQLPVVGGEIPLPDWSVFDDEDLVGLDETLRERFRANAIPEPLGVATSPQVLRDDRRYAVPVTVICCEFPAELFQGWVAAGAPPVAELARIRSVQWVDLPTGHWPQFSRPADLASAILDAAR